MKYTKNLRGNALREVWVGLVAGLAGERAAVERPVNGMGLLFDAGARWVPEVLDFVLSVKQSKLVRRIRIDRVTNLIHTC